MRRRVLKLELTPARHKGDTRVHQNFSHKICADPLPHHRLPTLAPGVPPSPSELAVIKPQTRLINQYQLTVSCDRLSEQSLRSERSLSPSIPNTLGWLYESLEILLPRAEQAGVRLLLENTPYCFRPTFDELVDVVREVNNEKLKIVYDVANAAYIREDPVACLLSGHSAIGLVHISDTGLEEWGHDPIGTGVVNFEDLGRAVEATCKVENVVLEIIRDKDPLKEINKGIEELKNRGWDLKSYGRL